MATQITRWLMATLNLALSGFLIYLWFFVPHGMRGMTDDFPGIVALTSVLLATIASTGAGIFLARQHTLHVGLKWHRAVGAAWQLFLLACIAECCRDRSLTRYDLVLLIYVTAIACVWPSLERMLRCFLRPPGAMTVRQSAIPTAKEKLLTASPTMTHGRKTALDTSPAVLRQRT